ncbi:MAG: polysaccharide biosynthesis/export family protein [bacterium]
MLEIIICLSLVIQPTILSVSQNKRDNTDQQQFEIFSEGDGVEIVIMGEPDQDDEQVYIIQIDGSIIFPLVGRIPVEGLTVEQAKDTITEYLRTVYRDPEVFVFPHWKVSVLGQVRNPGVYTVQGGTSVSRLLALAGGQGDRADLKKARLYREGVEYNLDITESMLYSGTSQDIILKSGDVVYIPRVWWPSWSEWGAILSTLTFIMTTYTFIKSMD